MGKQKVLIDVFWTKWTTQHNTYTASVFIVKALEVIALDTNTPTVRMLQEGGMGGIGQSPMGF